ncbi:L,D-transpeptidase [Pseudobutyrivibrio xylanivorans]|uniref:L,D-transpeptidase catalytic domain n=1 Tax=Pseudobutyrivibrio xylanivorans DSM 14809 TaxID=1123012 RepID=A0A1M6JXL4_PSEXY|nr:L,D-transpeptidase [Pseudobutyrivibrio xylanivorans]SHJ51378.1 L,D-transpeptidase catalytic domain [Pseudobutyrivibrio xylanivorans DSM 14809]
MKKIIFTLTVLVMIFALPKSSIIANATEITDFDPVYYAANNPDVVETFGNDPQILLAHYINCGQAEGRYKNANEEANGIVVSPEVIAPEVIDPSDTKQAVVEAPSLIGTVFENLPYPTYVDVDIDNQTVSYFENNVLVMQSPCVTGKTSAHRGTPKGTYSIKAHIPGKTLRGPTWKVWVDYWMRFTDSNIGLHDATWRSEEEFGGDTYVNHGSHGCVNLPYEFASQLFNKVNIGTKVVVR